ncbi:hypothetical protein ACLOJK_019465 [Asimina triloba]
MVTRVVVVLLLIGLDLPNLESPSPSHMDDRRWSLLPSRYQLNLKRKDRAQHLVGILFIGFDRPFRSSPENSLQAVMAAFDKDDGAPYLNALTVH